LAGYGFSLDDRGVKEWIEDDIRKERVKQQLVVFDGLQERGLMNFARFTHADFDRAYGRHSGK
jgi:hypothetical protein